jgi:hypothetical protein
MLELADWLNLIDERFAWVAAAAALAGLVRGCPAADTPVFGLATAIGSRLFAGASERQFRILAFLLCGGVAVAAPAAVAAAIVAVAADSAGPLR